MSRLSGPCSSTPSARRTWPTWPHSVSRSGAASTTTTGFCAKASFHLPGSHPAPGPLGVFVAPGNCWQTWLMDFTSRYVALGDSFTEGVGDDDPARPNGVRGWADRVAGQLGAGPPAAG